jgi:hypothetical protein
MREMGLLLPEDIWQCIASFIPQNALLRLISVNKAFYNIVLDTKYREIHWAKLDRPMIKSLVRLRCAILIESELRPLSGLYPQDSFDSRPSAEAAHSCMVH